MKLDSPTCMAMVVLLGISRSLLAGPVGACCLPTAECFEVTESICDAIEGMYQGDGTDCAGVTCTPFGACCLPDSICLQVDAVACAETVAGLYLGDSTACSMPCPLTGACCLLDGTCVVQTGDVCASIGGEYQGTVSLCADQCLLTITQSEFRTFVAGDSATVTLDAFDDRDGARQLVEVIVEIDVLSASAYTLENIAQEPLETLATYFATVTAQATIFSPMPVVLVDESMPIECSPPILLPGESCNYGGDFTRPGSTTFSTSTPGPEFIGQGNTFDVIIAGDAILQFNGSQFVITSVEAIDANVTVTYRYLGVGDCDGNGTPDDNELAVTETAWAGGDGAAFDDPMNWCPLDLDPTSRGVMQRAETIGATLTGDLAFEQFRMPRGDLTLSGNGFDLDLDAVTVGGSPDPASLTLDDVTLTSSAGVTICPADGAEGTVRLQGPNAQLIAPSIDIGFAGTGTIEVEGGFCFTFDASLGFGAGADGTMVLTGPGLKFTAGLDVLVRRGEVVLRSDAILRSNLGQLELRSGGALRGAGTVEANVFNAGRIDPGEVAPATLFVDGHLTVGSVDGFGGLQGIAGGVVFDLAGPRPGSDFDIIDIGGAFGGDLDLSGGLLARFDPGFVPVSGQTFQVLPTAGTRTGAFDVIYSTGLPADFFVTVDYDAPGGPTLEAVQIQDGLGFEDPDDFMIAGVPVDAVTGDFNPAVDDFDDLAVVLQSPPVVVVFFSAGTDMSDTWLGFDVKLQQTIQFGPTDLPRAITSADLLGDFALDLAVADEVGEVHILGNTNGTFTETQTITGTGAGTIDIDHGEVEGDADEDLAIVVRDESLVRFLVNAGGTFTLATTEVGTPGLPTALALVDLDIDGIVDLAVANASTDSVGVYVGGSAPGDTYAFTLTAEIATGDDPFDIDPGDLTGNKPDGFGPGGLPTIDLVVAASNSVAVIRNKSTAGALSLASAVSLDLEQAIESLETVDLDDDNDPDIAVVARDDMGERTVRVIRNNFDGTSLTLTLTNDVFGAGENPRLVTAGDVDNDGANDLITVSVTAAASAASESESRTARGGGGGAISAVSVRVKSAPCPCDLDDDNICGFGDILLIISSFGTANPAIDLDGSGLVDFGDLLIVLSGWGVCP